MKTLKPLLLLITITWISAVSAVQAEGQEKEFNRFNITTNPFGYFLGDFSLGAAYAVHENVAVNLNVGGLYLYFVEPKILGASASLGVPIYFEKAFQGFYLEPGARFIYATQEIPGSNDSVNAFVGGPALIAGHSWLFDSGFNIDLGVGLAYVWGGEDLTNSKILESVLPVGKLQFGYSF